MIRRIGVNEEVVLIGGLALQPGFHGFHDRAAEGEPDLTRRRTLSSAQPWAQRCPRPRNAGETVSR
ncbi:MAG: hypothetical protein MZV70_12075 [Desulfobacterales bacterium]|nr:hypothetical protein [Desulfobacterales bacterium]